MKPLLLGLLVSAAIAANAFAAPQVSHEQRRKMADLHEKMASCLRSDKPLNECRSEMRQSCQKMMGAQGCPMWGQMGGQMSGQMGGAMGGQMMRHGSMMGNSDSGAHQ